MQLNNRQYPANDIILYDGIFIFQNSAAFILLFEKEVQINITYKKSLCCISLHSLNENSTC